MEFQNKTLEILTPEVKENKNQFSKVLKEKYNKIKLKFNGTTWIRPLPLVKGSKANGWLHQVAVYGYDVKDKGKFEIISSDKASALFLNAYSILKQNLPAIFEPDGKKINFYPKKQAIAFCIVTGEKEDKGRLKVFKGSFYDGKFGGAPGLAYQMYLEATAKNDEPGGSNSLLYGDIADSEKGRLIGITAIVPPAGKQFTNYTVKIGKQEDKLNYHIQNLTDEEIELIRPLEEILYTPTEDEYKDFLVEFIKYNSPKGLLDEAVQILRDNKIL